MRPLCQAKNHEFPYFQRRKSLEKPSEKPDPKTLKTKRGTLVKFGHLTLAYHLPTVGNLPLPKSALS
jgi:hypothetical protein